MMSYYPGHATATQPQPGYHAPSPGRGFVRFQLTRSRQLRSGWLVRAAGCWGGLSTVSMNIQFHLATCHLHKSHITNSKQFCLNCNIKVTLRVPQLVSSPQFCDINLNIHSGYISTQYGDGGPVLRFPCPLCAMTDEAVMDGAGCCSLLSPAGSACTPAAACKGPFTNDVSTLNNQR